MYPNSYKTDNLRYVCDLGQFKIKLILITKGGLVFVNSTEIVSTKTICSKLIKVMYEEVKDVSE